MERRTYLFCFDSSILSIAVAKDPELPDDKDNWQGNLAPDNLLEGDREVRVRSVRVRRRVHKAGPGVWRGTKWVVSVSLPEYWYPYPTPSRSSPARRYSPAFYW